MTSSVTNTAAGGAPHAGRTVQIAPNHHVNLADAGHPLANHIPRTKLGGVALELSIAATTSVISIAATTAYVYALTELTLPMIAFRQPPPGTTIPVNSLQTAYDDFQTQLATYQSEAAAWTQRQTGTGTPSIVSQLVTIPSTLETANGAVQSDFAILSAEIPGTSTYDDTLSDLENEIGALVPPINNLNGQMALLGANLDAATVGIDIAGTTGVLAQLCQAYSSELAALQSDINSANSQINSNNESITALQVGEGTSVAVGAIGLANIWNPIGWIMIGSGAVSGYSAASEIDSLRGEIAQLTATIQNDQVWQSEDSAAAAAVQATIVQTQGFASMNAAAQVELTELENLLTTLVADINTALTELDQGQIQEALNEWNEIMSAASVLDLQAYGWPSPIRLANPTSFAAAGSDAYAVSVSGQAYHYPSGSAVWSNVASHSLSIVASGSLVVGVNGAPDDLTATSPPANPADFHVKTFNATGNSWTTISDFPAAQVATDGTSIYAINQFTTDRQAYKYNGSGTSWSALPPMPLSDAPQDIAVADGKLFAITVNSQQAYYYNGSSWIRLSPTTYAAISANGTQVGLIATNNLCFLYDASAGVFAHTGESSASSVVQVAQVSNGDQYVINTDQQLYFINNQGTPSVATYLKPNVVGVAVSDTNVVYYSDNDGNSFKLNDLGSNSWTQLPAFPS